MLPFELSFYKMRLTSHGKKLNDLSCSDLLPAVRPQEKRVGDDNDSGFWHFVCWIAID